MSALEAVMQLAPALMGLCIVMIFQVIARAKLQERVKTLEAQLKRMELLMRAVQRNQRGDK